MGRETHRYLFDRHAPVAPRPPGGDARPPGIARTNEAPGVSPGGVCGFLLFYSPVCGVYVCLGRSASERIVFCGVSRSVCFDNVIRFCARLYTNSSFLLKVHSQKFPCDISENHGLHPRCKVIGEILVGQGIQSTTVRLLFS